MTEVERSYQRTLAASDLIDLASERSRDLIPTARDQERGLSAAAAVRDL